MRIAILLLALAIAFLALTISPVVAKIGGWKLEDCISTSPDKGPHSYLHVVVHKGWDW